MKWVGKVGRGLLKRRELMYSLRKTRSVMTGSISLSFNAHSELYRLEPG